MKAKTTATDPVHIQYITQDRPGSFGSTDSYVWPFCAVKEHHHELELIVKRLMPHANSATISAFFVSNGRHSGLSVLGCLTHDHVPPPEARVGVGYR